MLALFALGIMSVFWMAVAALAILVEKLSPGGEAFARVLAVTLIVARSLDRRSPQGACRASIDRIACPCRWG